MLSSLRIVGVFLLVGTPLGLSAQVRCTMPNGMVIEQRLSTTCPNGATKAVTLDGAPAAVRSPAGIPPAPIVTDRRLVRSQLVTRDEFGGTWPLKVDRGTLRCMYPDHDRPQLHALLIVVDGVFYALNGIAKTHASRMGWQQIESIWLDNGAIPGTKVPITPLADRAAKLC